MRLISAEIRHIARRLASTPLLSFGAMLTLALGIGSAVVMVDVLDRLLLRAPEHIADPDRVTRLYVGGAHRPYLDRIDYATFDAVATLRSELDGSAVFFSEPLTLGRGQNARRLEALPRTRDYFGGPG